MPDKTTTLEPSSIETIDTGIFNWVDNTLDLTTKTNQGLIKTPVIWLGSERAFQVKNNKELRDSAGKLKMPLITVNRDSMTKDPSFKGVVQANLIEKTDYKGGTSLTIMKRIKQETS